MVAYLKKPEGSEGFHQIETATARIFDNGEIELTATIDGKVKIVTETSVRRHLQLAYSDGISSLPTTKIFEQLSLIGPKKTSWEQFSSNIATAIICLATNRKFNFSKLIFDGSMTLQELMVFCTTLSKKVESLETDLKQTKLTYGAAYTKVIKKVKKLENKVKSSQARRRARIIVSDDLEDPSKQGRKIAEIDQDPAISLDVSIAKKDVSTAKPVSIAGAAVTTASVDAVSIASPTRRVSTADNITMAETLVYIRKSATKDKAVRLQAELEEEERQRISRLHEVASSFNVKE
ncbi:hypothetical protein Tco_1078266 [Tanacetum coccineum]